MRQIEFSNLIKCSYQRTIHILFEPFSIKKWLWLMLIAYLAGGMGGGGSFNSNIPVEEKEASAMTAAMAQEAAAPDSLEVPGENMVLDMYSGRMVERKEEGQDVVQEKFLKSGDPLKSFMRNTPAWVFFLGAFGVLAAAAIIVFLTWVAARFKFVWFNSIVHNTTAIKEPFKRFRVPGDSLWLFYVIAGLLGMAAFVWLGFWAYDRLVMIGAFEEGFKWSLSMFMENFGFLPFLLLILGIASALLTVCIEHFVVTIMAVDQCKFLDAVRKFGGVYMANQWNFWLYLFILIGLGIAAMIVGAVLFFIAALILLLVGGTIFGFAYLLFAALLKLKALFVIAAIILGIPFAVLSLLLMMSIGLPIAIFFRCFSLYFLSSLECGYTPFPLDNTSEPTPAPEAG